MAKSNHRVFNAEPVHQLNCALLIPAGELGEVRACSCGATKPRTLDDASGEEWNAASAAYRDKIQARSWREATSINGEPSVGSPVASELWDASQGEVRSVSSTGGQKGVKRARFDLIPAEALAIVAEHYGRGAEKYEVHNWRKGFEWSKSYAAMQRHLHAFWSGEDIDPETGSPHLAAVVFHALTLLTFMQEQQQFDDRYTKGTN